VRSRRRSNGSLRPSTRRAVGRIALLCFGVAAGGCQIAEQSPPSLTGPSELGLSLTLEASPSLITQDGFSFSRVTVTARDASSQGVRDVVMRAEILVNGAVSDFGQLSTRTVITGSDGRATLIYTAPPPPLQAVDTFTIVTLLFTPLETNFANAVARSLDIRLVPPGVLLPPNGAPLASFSFSAPTEQGTAILFDGSASADSDGTVVSYAWDFGDGTTGTGVRVHHTYSRAATFSVILTVTDNRGQQGTTTRQVSVTATTNPIAAFDLSPTSPKIGDQVVFNASAATAATGRRIANYLWTFGDGGSSTGVITGHAYGQSGTFTVVLTVTDDLGRTGTTSKTVTVGAQTLPTAVFVVSPSTADINQPIFFDASTSTAPAPQSVVAWAWSFGDSTTGEGRQIQHSYAQAGTYTVLLQVTDSAGQRGTTSKTVTVGLSPTAKFVVSPSPATVGATVTFNAAESTAPAGTTVATYSWNFGDGGGIETVSSNSRTHVYAAAGSYTITLTVTTSTGQTATVNQTLVVNP